MSHKKPSFEEWAANVIEKSKTLSSLHENVSEALKQSFNQGKSDWWHEIDQDNLKEKE